MGSEKAVTLCTWNGRRCSRKLKTLGPVLPPLLRPKGTGNFEFLNSSRSNLAIQRGWLPGFLFLPVPCYRNCVEMFVLRRSCFTWSFNVSLELLVVRFQLSARQMGQLGKRRVSSAANVAEKTLLLVPIVG